MIPHPRGILSGRVPCQQNLAVTALAPCLCLPGKAVVYLLEHSRLGKVEFLLPARHATTIQSDARP